MSIFATCGHEISVEQMMIGYWWKSYDNEGVGLSYGCLCPKCVEVFEVVEADSYEEAWKKLGR